MKTGLQSYAQVHRPPHYHYSYQVMDPQYEGAQYGQQEFRHGEKTQGEYHVRLPDGRYQSVNYQVDGAAASGFIADVSYDEGMLRVNFETKHIFDHSIYRITHNLLLTLYS